MENNSLYHHGIKGMRWGERRWQYNDGTLTPAGKKRYAKASADAKRKAKADEKAKSKAAQQEKAKSKAEEAAKAKSQMVYDKHGKPTMTIEEAKANVLKSRSAKTVYENRKLLNKQEMKDAYDILKLDDDVKKLIVEDPSKLDKFLTRAGDLATKVKNIVEPTVAVISKINSLMKVLDGNNSTAKTSTSNNGGKNNPPNDKNNQSNDTNTKAKTSTSNNGGKNNPSNDKNSQSNDKNTNSDAKPPIDLKKLFYGMSDGTAYYDARWEPSGSTRSFVSGYLPGPKEDD